MVAGAIEENPTSTRIVYQEQSIRLIRHIRRMHGPFYREPHSRAVNHPAIQFALEASSCFKLPLIAFTVIRCYPPFCAQNSHPLWIRPCPPPRVNFHRTPRRSPSRASARRSTCYLTSWASDSPTSCSRYDVMPHLHRLDIMGSRPQAYSLCILLASLSDCAALVHTMESPVHLLLWQ